MFPRLYSNETCPLEGYDGFTFRVLLNPTAAEKTDWALGHLGAEHCPACAGLNQLPAFDGTAEREAPARAYCPSCAEARARLGRSAVAIFGQSQVSGFDFSTPDAALASFSQDGLPDEFLYWLFALPGALWEKRTADLKKKLIGS
jgi:hypothetical protein